MNWITSDFPNSMVIAVFSFLSFLFMWTFVLSCLIYFHWSQLAASGLCYLWLFQAANTLYFVELILYCERFQIKIVVVVDNNDSTVNKEHNVYVVVCRDRVSALWSTVRDHLSNILVNAAQHRYELNNKWWQILVVSSGKAVIEDSLLACKQRLFQFIYFYLLSVLESELKIVNLA